MLGSSDLEKRLSEALSEKNKLASSLEASMNDLEKSKSMIKSLQNDCE